MNNYVSGSFRDPSGFIFKRDEILYRQVNQSYRANYENLMESGLYDRLTKSGTMVPHEEVALDLAPLPQKAYKIIRPEMVDFISYPYEWCFSQLKDAALLTLWIAKVSLEYGMILKDASAFNIQFKNGQPIFLDTLSFEIYHEGMPWDAYRQFCQHFLAPLALMSKVDVRLGKFLINHIDGIPLDLCSQLLPFTSRFNLGLFTHIFLHAKAQARYANSSKSANEKIATRKPTITKLGLIGLIESLENTVKGLSFKISNQEWANYYQFTNYSETAFTEKKVLIRNLLQSIQPKVVLDLGANTGLFSREAAEAVNCLVISSDFDAEAVEINYRQLKKNGPIKHILPLVIDLTNPSPAIGWDNSERNSFFSRVNADAVIALALIHHLAIGNNVPLENIAKMLHRLGENLILEFVPKEDSQVERLLRSRKDIFDDYHLEGLQRAFDPFFILEKQLPITGSERTVLLYKRKEIRKR